MPIPEVLLNIINHFHSLIKYILFFLFEFHGYQRVEIFDVFISILLCFFFLLPVNCFLFSCWFANTLFIFWIIGFCLIFMLHLFFPMYCLFLYAVFYSVGVKNFLTKSELTSEFLNYWVRPSLSKYYFLKVLSQNGFDFYI